MVFIYNYRESVPVKIDSLGFLGEGKENWTIFSWPHCGIFKTSNEKAPHKLEVKIAKNPFMSHTFLKGKGQLAFPPSLLCWSKRETPRIKADFGISDWLRSMRPPCCCNVDPQEPASLRG